MCGPCCSTPMKPQVCPKCGRPYVHLNYLGEPDMNGIVGVVSHKREEVVDLFGGTHIAYSDRCFLTEEEWRRT